MNFVGFMILATGVYYNGGVAREFCLVHMLIVDIFFLFLGKLLVDIEYSDRSSFYYVEYGIIKE